jgi:hypothetical protein
MTNLWRALGVVICVVAIAGAAGAAPSSAKVVITGDGVSAQPFEAGKLIETTIVPAGFAGDPLVSVSVDGIPCGLAQTPQPPTVSYEDLWRVLNWYPNPGDTTTRSVLTVDLSVDQDLRTFAAGGMASENITATLQLFGDSGPGQTLIDDDADTFVESVADGDSLVMLDTVSLSVTSPPGLVDDANNGWLVLTIEAGVEAFTPCPSETIPAPGAIALGALGTGLAAILRRRWSS